MRRLLSASTLWRICAIVMLMSLAARPLAGQRGNARGAQAIRAEYAGVLLQAGKYDEAAREYRVLIASNPRDTEYRLALARALAWGGHPRDAEWELRTVRAQRPNDRAVTTLLRTTRESYTPDAREAQEWLADDPTHAPYRLALARALVREGEPRAAVAQYDLLVALRRPIETRPPLGTSGVLRESAEARVAAGDRAEGVRQLREALARNQGDTALRHGLAVVLTSGRTTGEALAHYDTLLAPFGVRADGATVMTAGGTARERTTRASLLMDRARVHVARGDARAAERDATASLASHPTVEAHLLLGDMARWRGQYAAARGSYERAGAMQPGSVTVSAALGQLAREEHPALAFAPSEGGEAGWRASGSATGDNLGVRYFTASARRGFELPKGIRASIGVQTRRLSENSSIRTVSLNGYAAEAAVSRDAQTGLFYGRMGAHAGLVGHQGAGAEPEGSLSVAGWYRAWGMGIEVRSALAYPSLLTVGSLRPSLVEAFSASSDTPLREESATASIAGPVARADLALVGQRSRISDGNVRSTIQLHARMPLAPHVSMIFAGSGVRYAERSTLYWDPIGYVSNATGLEYAVRRTRGFTYALQVLPGVAWANESTNVPLGALRSTALSVTSAGDASYRAESWEAGAALSYNRGRAGNYERLGANVHLRLRP